METIVERLHASEPEELGFGVKPLQIRAYLLEREQGNLLVYRSAQLGRDRDVITGLGGISDQYLNHSHEAGPPNDEVRRDFGAPLLVHAGDAEASAEVAQVDRVFSERHTVGEDFEVIPIPGHTPGATAFLWDTGEHRILFTGDSVYVRDGEWNAALLEGVSDRDSYVASLEALAQLDFDVLVPGVSVVGDAPSDQTDPATARERLLAIAQRLRDGGDH